MSSLDALSDEQLAWIRGCCLARLRRNIKEHARLKARQDQSARHFAEFLEHRSKAIQFAQVTIAALTAELTARGRNDLLQPRKERGYGSQEEEEEAEPVR